MNHPIRRMALGVLILLGLLLANLSYIQVFRADALNNRADNKRRTEALSKYPRGNIMVGNQAIATSEKINGSSKYQRRYTNGPLYASVTGFFSSEYTPTGIEGALDSTLRGDSQTNQIRRLFHPEENPNRNVVLTINPKAQAAAAKALGNRKGAVVALDPSTGAVLAMVTSPTYDPNTLAAQDPKLIRQTWKALNTNKDKPMLNRAVSENYPPGSTFKLVTTAAALSQMDKDPSSQIAGPGTLPLPGTRNASINNHNGVQCTPGSETTTLQEALRQSCNTSFAQLGLDLKLRLLREQADRFGFNTQHDIPFRTAASVFPDKMDDAALAQSAIGQRDVKATPLQMAMVAAGIANGGTVMKPYLWKEITNSKGEQIDKNNPDELSEAINSEQAEMLTTMMIEVVNKGTGTNAQIEGIQVAGKTGTAQQGEDARGRKKPPHAWFVSFAPAGQLDNPPKVAVAVIVEDGDDDSEATGNKLAAPIAKAVMEAVLQ